MNPIKAIINKLNQLRRKQLAKKYGEMYESLMQLFLVAVIKTLQKTDKVKTDIVINDTKFMVNTIKDFVKNHGPYIVSTIKQLGSEISTNNKEYNEKMKEIGKIITTVFNIK
jgi:hypothetical protein